MEALRFLTALAAVEEVTADVGAGGGATTIWVKSPAALAEEAEAPADARYAWIIPISDGVTKGGGVDRFLFSASYFMVKEVRL